MKIWILPLLMGLIFSSCDNGSPSNAPKRKSLSPPKDAAVLTQETCDSKSALGLWQIAGDSELFASQSNLINEFELLIIEADRLGVRVRCRTDMGNFRYVEVFAPLLVEDKVLEIVEFADIQSNSGDAVCAVSLEPLVIGYSACDDELELRFGSDQELLLRHPE